MGHWSNVLFHSSPINLNHQITAPNIAEKSISISVAMKMPEASSMLYDDKMRTILDVDIKNQIGVITFADDSMFKSV